ncbi:MAG: secondary thiamine-phosphate synthase enzyme YjbQ, partial [Candidatus Fermentibacteraceae bacterium]|nr:secondary thiamine-phosphate synthase enzyme YjbQ [Candidatus Fermentibacteraceae bacterium]
MRLRTEITLVYGQTLTFNTKGFSDIINITGEVGSIIESSGITEGLVAVTVIGSTASITTIEYEPALVEDMKEQLEKMVSQTIRSRHSETWGDDNGFSHLRASLMGPGITLPIVNGNILIGTWQQIVLIDHDNRQRSRKVRIQIIGECE